MGQWGSAAIGVCGSATSSPSRETSIKAGWPASRLGLLLPPAADYFRQSRAPSREAIYWHDGGTISARDPIFKSRLTTIELMLGLRTTRSSQHVRPRLPPSSGVGPTPESHLGVAARLSPSDFEQTVVTLDSFRITSPTTSTAASFRMKCICFPTSFRLTIGSKLDTTTTLDSKYSLAFAVMDDQFEAGVRRP